MKGLTFYCKNQFTQKCDNRIIKRFFPKRIEEGEVIPLWPVGKEIEKYDKICKECEYRYFNIDELEEKICPVCGNLSFIPSLPSPIKTSGFTKEYLYKCINCKTTIYSIKKL
jgi:hypothetical protein